MIDTSRFVSGPHLSPIIKQITIAAPVEAVFAAWTHGQSFARAYDPENELIRADIELRIGGPYEWLWDGETGSNDCHVLSFIPGRMVSFSWNAPPGQAESREMRTWVVVECEPAPPRATRVTLTHQGFGHKRHWVETRDYFQSAWDVVLERFRQNLERDAGSAQV